MWLSFQSFPLLYEASTASNGANLISLTPPVMADNFAENVSECPLNWGH